MSGISTKFDPWGPISSVLYEINDSDFVQTAIANTGIEIEWTPFSKADAYSHGTRIRALRRDIAAAYAQMDNEARGLAARIVVKSMLRHRSGDELRESLRARLQDICWTIDESGNLVTQDVLVSEQFFPSNSEYDAYVAIRDVLGNTTKELIIEDPYIGTSLLTVLRTINSTKVHVRILTVAKNLPPDFAVELAAFRKQYPGITVEIRHATNFHDRFIIADDDVYHVGASIKDAGKRVFMINLVQDQANKDKLIGSIEQAWTVRSLSNGDQSRTFGACLAPGSTRSAHRASRLPRKCGTSVSALRVTILRERNNKRLAGGHSPRGAAFTPAALSLPPSSAAFFVCLRSASAERLS